MAVFFDRFLASVEAYRIPAILVFNKIDLYDEEDLLLLGALTQIYMQVGYECLHVSSLTGEGMEDVVTALKDKVTVFSGLSGGGKIFVDYSCRAGIKTESGGDFTLFPGNIQAGK